MDRLVTPPAVEPEQIAKLLRKTTLALALSLAFPIICLAACVFFLVNSISWVERSDRVIEQSHVIARELVTMQTNFRGFRLTADQSYAERYEEGKQRLPAHLESLESRVATSTRNLAEIPILRSEIDAWLDYIEREFVVGRGEPSTMRNPGILRGAPLFDAAHKRLDGITKSEQLLQVNRSRWQEVIIVSLSVALALLAFLGIPFLVSLVRRRIRRISTLFANALDAEQIRSRELSVTLYSIGDAVIATDAHGQINFLNPEAEKLTGWVSGEAKGLALCEVFQIFNELSGEEVESPVDRVLRENVVVGLANHTVLRARDGREIPIEDSAAPIRNENGSVRGVILVFRDATQTRTAQREMEEREGRLRLLHDLGDGTRALADPAEIMDVTIRLLGRHLRASRCAYAEVASDSEQFQILRDYSDECPSTVGLYELTQFGVDTAKQIREGKTLVLVDVNKELSPEEGGLMFNAIGVQAIVCCPLVKEGRLRSMMAVHQTTPRTWSLSEISLVEEIGERCWATIERARAEANEISAFKVVAETAERFRALSEVVSIQVWTAISNGELDFANSECQEYFGVANIESILGHEWASFVHPEDLPLAQASWEQSLKSGSRYEVEFRLRRFDGEYRWFLVRAEALRLAGGQITKWFGTNTDVHDLRVAKAEAERAARAKDNFLAALSHELRTPLTPVLMTASELRDDPRLPDNVRTALAMIERNIGLEARLIDDLLDLTRISKNKLPIRLEPCDAHSLIGLAVDILKDEALAKAISLKLQLSAQRCGLIADPSRFQQVIWNLLRNAVKFTPEGGHIEVETSNESCGENVQLLKIVVRDSGVGIEAKALHRIFEPFEQAELPGEHKFGGLGLGLSIAQSIVKLHGGTIQAASDGAGCGATFTVRFPGAADLYSGLIEIPSPKGLDPNNGGLTETTPLSRRILLVEDHESTLKVMERLLTNAGHRVVPVGTIQEALAAAGRESFDLVISDLGLPDGTGNDLMRQLKQKYDLRGIALTGYGMDHDIIRSEEAGFVAHLIKPVDFTVLKRAIASFQRS